MENSISAHLRLHSPPHTMPDEERQQQGAADAPCEQQDEEPCTIRFCSQREGSASVVWVNVDAGNKEQLFAKLDQGCFYNQETYVGHLWRLRDAADGTLLGEYAGPCATLTLLPSGLRVQPGLVRPPTIDIYDPRWGHFRPRGAAAGLPILAFDCVCQEAVEAAELILDCMLAGAPAWVLAALAEAAADVAIIGKDQGTTDLPMYRHLRGVPCGNGGGDYDSATRGLGGNSGNPTTSCGEENLLMLEGDRYRQENILVHEFGHAVMDLGLQGSPLQDEIRAAFEAAATSGAYDPACYMMANASEYWAEGTQAWFDATVREDVTSGVNTREKLKARDPRLAAILAAVYGDGEWRYPAIAPRPFAPCRQRPSKDSSGTDGAAAAGGGAGGSQPALQAVVEQDNPLQQQQQQQALEVGSDSSMAQPLLRRGRRRGGSPSRHGDSGGKGRGRLALARRRLRRALSRALGSCFSWACGLAPQSED